MIVFETFFIWTLLLKKITLFITFKVTPDKIIRELPIGEPFIGLPARCEEWLPLWGRKHDWGREKWQRKGKGPGLGARSPNF